MLEENVSYAFCVYPLGGKRLALVSMMLSQELTKGHSDFCTVYYIKVCFKKLILFNYANSVRNV